MCMTCTMMMNDAKKDAFAERFTGMLNDGMTVMMCSLGHRTGLFDAMADGMPRTSMMLAEEAGLHERYVREWLGAMVAGRIVERDPATGMHRLPPEHGAWLTRMTSMTNMAAFAQYIPHLGAVEEKVLACFQNGGGVPYSEYPRFQEVMAEESGQTIVPYMVDTIVPAMPGMHERLTAGMDVLDIGCGKGMALMQLARAYPMSHFMGYDLSLEAVTEASAMARDAGMDNLHFMQMDLTHWDEPMAYDWIMALDAIHDQARPDRVLSAVRRALRPGGVFLMQDLDVSSEPVDNMDHPMGAMIYTISCMHCMTVSLAQGGMGLGAAWGVQLAEAMLRYAGFEDILLHRFAHDTQNAYFMMQT